MQMSVIFKSVRSSKQESIYVTAKHKTLINVSDVNQK